MQCRLIIMENQRPLILISNDDGYQAKGINELVRMVRGFGDIIVCAPEGHRSGQSRAFSMTPLTMKKVSEEPGITVYACSGTPVDCVKMAYHQVCPRKPDLVLGGINHGDNASTNSHYSGTVGIVIEGAMKFIPSIAFSQCDYRSDADFEPMTDIVQNLVQKVLENGLPEYTCLNVNFPLVDGVKGVKLCRMAHGHWRKEVEKRTHPTGMMNYYWMTGFYQNDEPEAEDTDAWALANGYVSITPLTVDSTDFKALKEIEKFF